MPKTDFSYWHGCEVPDELEALMHYLETPKGMASDWELIYSPEGHAETWKCKQGHPLVPLFELPHGSIIAGWNLKEISDLSQMPFLWLDSEGEPHDVFAADYLELLRLMHYYSGSIYDILRASMRHAENPDRFKNPEVKFPPANMEESVQEDWAENEWLLDLHHFLEKAGIPIETNPASAILTAFQAFPRFEPDWQE